MRVRINQKLVDEMAAPTPPTVRWDLWDLSIPSFTLRVGRRKRVYYVAFRNAAGRQRRYKLGEHPIMTADEARRAAIATLAAVKSEGRDPAAERFNEKTRRKDLTCETVQAVWEKYKETPNHKRRRTAVAFERMFKGDVLAHIGDVPVASVTSSDVRRLRDLKANTGALVTSNRVLTGARTFFQWCVEEEIISVNPAATVRKVLKAEPTRERVLSDAELQALWQATERFVYRAGAYEGQPRFVDRAYIRLLVLLAQRAGETRRMRWSDLDFDAATWTISGRQTKSGVPALVPLPDLAIETLKTVPRIEACDFVFSKDGKAPMHQQSGMLEDLNLVIGEGIREHWTLHDLRRTARTNFARLGVGPDIGEMLLNHSLHGSRIRAVYDRFDYLDAKRDGLARWAAYVATRIATVSSACAAVTEPSRIKAV
ncbi:MAG: tyrosine-type recombinase/integrase [Pseudomonadota bacterium]